MNDSSIVTKFDKLVTKSDTIRNERIRETIHVEKNVKGLCKENLVSHEY